MKGSPNSAGNPISYLPTRDAVAAPAAFIPTNRGTGPSLDTPEFVSLYWGDFAQAEIDGMQSYLNGLTDYLSGQRAPAGQEPTVRQYGVTSATVGANLFYGPYNYFLLQTGTFITEADGAANYHWVAGDFNKDGIVDLIGIKVTNTGTGMVEAHVLAPGVSDGDVRQLVTELQNQTRLPPFSSNRLFLVFTKGISFTIIVGGSYGSWCGFHNQWDDGQYYAICPFPSVWGCGSANPIQSWQSITSHEILEATTDPKPFTGWTPEVGDQCAWQEVALSFGTVQKVADNLQQTCSVWTPILMTDTALAVVGAGNNVEFFAKSLDGRIFYNYAQFGQGSQGWNEVPGDFRTDAAPAAGAIGTYVYVAIKSPDGNLWLNQGTLGGGFVGWGSMT